MVLWERKKNGKLRWHDMNNFLRNEISIFKKRKKSRDKDEMRHFIEFIFYFIWYIW